MAQACNCRCCDSDACRPVAQGTAPANSCDPGSCEYACSTTYFPCQAPCSGGAGVCLAGCGKVSPPRCAVGQMGCGGGSAACTCVDFLQRCDSSSSKCVARATGVAILVLAVILAIAATAYYCHRVGKRNAQKEALLAHQDGDATTFPNQLPSGNLRHKQRRTQRRGIARPEQERAVHCATLELSAANCTLEQVKSAHRRLALLHHPDRGGDPARFAEIHNAYEALSNILQDEERSGGQPTWPQTKR